MQQSNGLVNHLKAQPGAPLPHRQIAFRLRFFGAIIAFTGPFMFMSVAAGLDETVAIRQREMKEIAAATKIIADVFKFPEKYSSQDFKQAARAISNRAGQRLVENFDMVTTADGSKATEAIGGARDRFDDLAQDLKTYADRLATAADEHPDKMTEDMRMTDKEPMGGGPLGTRMRSEASVSSMSAEHSFHLMLQTCTACHSRFRRSN